MNNNGLLQDCSRLLSHILLPRITGLSYERHGSCSDIGQEHQRGAGDDIGFSGSKGRRSVRVGAKLGSFNTVFFASDSFLISTCPIDNAHLVPYSGTPKLLEVELG